MGRDWLDIRCLWPLWFFFDDFFLAIVAKENISF